MGLTNGEVIEAVIQTAPSTLSPGPATPSAD